MRNSLLILITIISINIFSQTIRINEISAINSTIITDNNGEYDDFIELYNYGTSAVSLTGMYLTDNFSLPNLFLIDTNISLNPGEYILFWADNEATQGKLHTNFKLSGSGEQVGLYSSTTTVIDSITYGNQFEDISYGRYPNGSTTNIFFPTPSPNAENTNGYSGVATEPSFSLSGGNYQGTQTISLIPNTNNDTIYYTLNGDDPTKNSTIYTSPITITQTTVIRAVSGNTNLMLSRPVSNIYFINETHNLPVFSIITDSLNMWGTIGIYSHPWGTGDTWQRFCQAHYFKNGDLEFASNAGIRIQGGNSVGMAKKAFRLFYENKYGQNKLHYPLFENSPVSSFENLVLRSGYDDDITTYGGTLIRDPFANDMYRYSGGWASRGNWAILTINNRYWGVYNIRESINEFSISNHTGYTDFDLIRYTKTGPELKYGTMTEWNNLTNFINSADWTDNANFYQISNIIDMDDFINLLAYVHITQNRGWTWGSFAFKENSPQGRWRWTIWDMDRALDVLNWNGFTEYAYTNAEKWPNFMPKKMLNNTLFKHRLINRCADLMNTLFLPDTAIAKLDSTKAIVYNEMPNELARWNSNKTMAAWENDINKINTFLTNRPNTVRNQILSYFSLPATNTINLSVVGNGKLHLSTINIPSNPWSGIYFENVPVEITAIPDPGYVFTGWSDTNLPNQEQVTLNFSGTYDLIAYFEEDISFIYDTLVINEIMYNASTSLNSDDWIELYNPNNFNVDISNWVFKDANNSHEFLIPSGSSVASGQYILLTKALTPFTSTYSNITADKYGDFGEGTNGFGLSNSGELIRLYSNYGTLIDSVVYDEIAPWPTQANGFGPSLELISPAIDNTLAESWRSSYIDGGTPGKINGTTSIIELSDNIINIISVYPNPSNGTINIDYNLHKKQYVNIELYNIKASKIETWESSFQNKGHHTITNKTNLENGMYFLKINIDDKVYTHKIIIE